MTQTPTREIGITTIDWQLTVDGDATGDVTGEISGHAWVITEDRVEDGLRKGTLGPGNADDRLLELVQKTGDHRVRFRMYDDDGIYYYGGFLTYDPAIDEEAAAYAPLGDFGAPNAGATRISYADRPDLDCS